jgi:hypothetical protein
MSENLGGIDITISLDTAQLLDGAKDVQNALSQIDNSSSNTGKELDGLDKSTSATGTAFTELAGYANSMDNQLKKLNTNVSGIARAMAEARSGTGGASSEFSRAESIIEALGNQIAVLDEAQEGGARSAAVLAAQLRAGSKASDEEKQKIGELTGRLYDMKTGVENGAKGTGKWKGSMQQAGYQVQDFIVQVQGGQSALVAFSQQGSQLAGAFGPGGAVIGAVIALSTVIAGTLITSLNGGKNAMDALKDAAEAMDKVITVSQNGVAALSDKYALLAKTNAEVATLMRNQALLEYNEAINKIPKAISDASGSLLSFGDKALSAFSGGYATVQGFNDRLASLNITTNDYTEAMKQAFGAGQAFNSTTLSIGNTVGAVADKFAISEQQAFNFAKQLSDIAKNPSPEALQKLASELQNTQSSTEKGQTALTSFIGTLVNLSREAVVAKGNVAALKQETDNLTAGQKNLIQQSERNLALSKLQGEARARLQAQYAAEDAGFSKDDPHAVQMQADAEATYKNTQAQKGLTTERKKSVSQSESIAQKLDKLKQQSEITAASTQELSKEQAILTAQQSLGKNATQEQIALAGVYAAKTYDNAQAIKAQAAAEKSRQDTEKAYKGVRAQVSPVTSVDNQFQQQMADLNAYAALYPQKISEVEATRAAIEKIYRDQRMAAMWEEWSQQTVATQLFADTLQTSMNTVSSSITGILNGTQSVNEALGNIANTVLSSVVQSFTQMGVEWVKSAIMGQTAQIAATAATTAASVAGTATTTAASTTAAATTTAAWTPAAIVASIGSFGGAAAIGIGAVVAAMALSGSIAGKRKNGGPVSAGSMYQVGEGGMPEIYQASNGSQYMIPGDNGKVISNKDMQGNGGGGVVVNINNYTSSAVDAQATPDGNGGWTVDAFVYDISNGGPASQAIQQYHQAPRKARG